MSSFNFGLVHLSISGSPMRLGATRKKMRKLDRGINLSQDSEKVLGQGVD